MFRKNIIAIAAALFLLVCLGSAGAQSVNKDTAVIIATEGVVSVRGLEKEWEPGMLNMPITEETRIRTGAGSHCDVALDDTLVNIVSIDEESDVVFGRYANHVEIVEGRVFTLLDNLKTQSSFEVRTPVAAGGARGTGWLTIVGKGEVTFFGVIEGIVHVMGIGPMGSLTGEQDVSGEEGLDVDDAGKLGSKRSLTPREIRQLRLWVERLRALGDSFKGGSLADVLKKEAEKDPRAFKMPEKKKGGMMPEEGTIPDLFPGGDITTQTFSPEDSSTPSSSGGDSGDSGGDQEIRIGY